MKNTSPFHFYSLVNTQALLSLKSEASKFYLGYLWWIIEPILFVLVFYLVFEILLDSGKDNFLLFLMLGKVPFLWFSKAVTGSAPAILFAQGLIQQVNVPKLLFPYSLVQESLYKETVVFLLLIALVILFFGHYPGWHWFGLIPLFVVLYLFVLCSSLIAALVVVFFPDMRLFINMFVMLMMFVSGVFWDVHMIPNEFYRELLLTLNPLALIIDGYRSVLLYDSWYSLMPVLNLFLVLLVVLSICHFLYEKYNRVIALKVVS